MIIITPHIDKKLYRIYKNTIEFSILQKICGKDT